MKSTRRFSIAALIVACTHLVFGAIVRISGSGLGCGENWPKCYGYWFPPFSRPDLVIEVSHRYLASILTLTVLSMAFVAFRNRREPGIGGPGGALRSALGAVGAVFTAAALGGLTVKMGNAPWATVAHWLVAMTLLAMVATTAIRTGALGGRSSLVQRGSARAKRSAFAAAGLAIFAVAMGGMTAKYPGAPIGCTTIPLCGPNPTVAPSSIHIQMIHRTFAVLLVLHLFGMVMMFRKRGDEEAPVVRRALHIAFGMVLLQLVVASSMILLHLPPVLRSLHEATGVGIWLSCFALAYLARRASFVPAPEPVVVAPSGGTGSVRAPAVRTSSVAAATAVVEHEPTPRQGAAPKLSVAPEITAAPEISVAPEITAAPELEVATEISSAAEVGVVTEVSAAAEVGVVTEVSAAAEVDVEPEPLAAPEALAAPEVIAAPEALPAAEPHIAPEPNAPAAQSAAPEPDAAPAPAPAPAKAPTITPVPPQPPAHTMAVIVARGADL